MNDSSEYSSLKDKYADLIEYFNKNAFLFNIEAIISAGKSTLIKSIKRICLKYTIKCNIYLENIPQVLLELFYSDTKKYAFSLQSIVIRDRIHIAENAIQHLQNADGNLAFIDRSRYGDAAFALMHIESGNISSEEATVYSQLVKSDRLDEIYTDSDSYLYVDQPVGEYIVYLDRTPEKARELVIKRGDPTEIKNCTIEYLSSLEHYYEKILTRKGDTPIEENVLNEVWKYGKNVTVIHIEYNDDNQLDADGYLSDEDVLKFLAKLHLKINQL